MTPTADPAIVDRLVQHRTLAAAPRGELEWLAARGHLLTFKRGEVLTAKTGPVKGVYVILSGHFTIHVDRGTGLKKVMEWRAGDATGVLPYSRLVAPPGDVIAQETSEVWALDREQLPDLIHACYELTSIFVHVMVDRARHFTSSDFQDEKMVSLGKLAAGLAHELNNPASAVARNAKELHGAIVDLETASRGLGASGLTPDHMVAIDELRTRCTQTRSRILTPMQRSDWEEELVDWLDAHGVDASMAGPLAESAASLDDLDRLASLFDGAQLLAAVRWIAAGCHVQQLVSETEHAAARIHSLVAAVKGFTYMDQAAAPVPVDVERSLSDTLSMLAAKARAKTVGLTLDVPPGLPRVLAIGGELNQVWVNLIDNAIDAVGEAGEVTITARVEGGEVVVSIVDNGPGIPPDIQTRIYDPFFTTKPVGQGTGLGLDITRRLVRRAEGSIELASTPGRTEFRVALPIPPASDAPGQKA